MALNNASSIEIEDILNDSLELFGGDPIGEEEGLARYGPLALTVSPKEGKANTLLADHLFSPALVIAERIELGKIDLCNATVLELGAGAALPTLLASTLPRERAPSLAVVTDYPDPTILDNLARNVSTNHELYCATSRVLWRGHEWGTDNSEILALDPLTANGYSILILSDLLHFDASHEVLLKSTTSLLKRSSDSRVYVGAGKYTPARVCDQWLALSRAAGLAWEEVDLDGENGVWEGKTEVFWSSHKMNVEQLEERKRNCRLWIGRWSTASLEA